MENHKIDRLFQDKLSRHEVAPSPQAWEAINAELKKDNKPMVWLSIAASIALVATIGWLLMRNDQEVVSTGVQTYAAVDQPSPQAPHEWNLELPTEKQLEVKPIEKVKKPVKQVKPVVEMDTMNETLAQQSVEQKQEDSFIEIESLGMDAMANLTEDTQPEMTELDTTPIESLPGVSVQITYKASPPVKVEEKSRIERLWAKAKEIRPGEVLADIRETKNDFFNGKKN